MQQYQIIWIRITSERQIPDLAILFSSADQIDLYFIQLFVIIWQFCGTDKNKLSFFLINVSTKLYPKLFLIFYDRLNWLIYSIILI